MIKSGKNANAQLTVSAWAAVVGLPEATPAMVASAASKIQDATNPAPPGTAQDPMDGHAGSISRAFNTIVLGCVGYRVPVALIKAELASRLFDTSKGVRPGLYNPNHTSDLVFEKKHENGHMTLSCGKGWVAVNPEWHKLLATPVVAPTEATIENAVVLGKKPASKPASQPASKPATASDNPTIQAMGLGKLFKNNKKPKCAKAKEAALEPTAAGLQVGANVVK